MFKLSKFLLEITISLKIKIKFKANRYLLNNKITFHLLKFTNKQKD